MNRRQEGQALVETALAMPALLIMIIAILSFGYLFSTKLALINACREGARIGSLNPTGTGGQSEILVKQTTTDFLKSSGLDPASAVLLVQGAGGVSGSTFSVQVTYPVSMPLPIPGFPNPIQLSGKTVMRID